jgi:D-aminopeptidase
MNSFQMTTHIKLGYYLIIMAMFFCGVSTNAQTRTRDLGLSIGVLSPGENNAITDVKGVLVGHTTLMSGDSVRTGVTAILPYAGNIFQRKVPAAIFTGNGFGKLAGSTQVNELGNLETPVVLTNRSCALYAITGWK